MPLITKIPASPLLEIYHILHWKILKNLTGYLNSDVQLWMSKFEERKHKEGLQIGQLSTKLSGPLHILDSQFHLDQLSRQMGSGAFQHLGDLGSQSTCKTALKYAIANLYFRQLVQTQQSAANSGKITVQFSPLAFILKL